MRFILCNNIVVQKYCVHVTIVRRCPFLIQCTSKGFCREAAASNNHPSLEVNAYLTVLCMQSSVPQAVISWQSSRSSSSSTLVPLLSECLSRGLYHQGSLPAVVVDNSSVNCIVHRHIVMPRLPTGPDWPH